MVTTAIKTPCLFRDGLFNSAEFLLATNESIERFQGSILGLALGDALGAPLEGGLIERFTWQCISVGTRTKLRWTDDTQMSLDTAESLLANGSLDPVTTMLGRLPTIRSCWQSPAIATRP